MSLHLKITWVYCQTTASGLAMIMSCACNASCTPLCLSMQLQTVHTLPQAGISYAGCLCMDKLALLLTSNSSRPVLGVCNAPSCPHQPTTYTRVLETAQVHFAQQNGNWRQGSRDCKWQSYDQQMAMISKCFFPMTNLVGCLSIL